MARATRAGQYPNRSLRSPYPAIRPARASVHRGSPMAGAHASSQATLAGPYAWMSTGPVPVRAGWTGAASSAPGRGVVGVDRHGGDVDPVADPAGERGERGADLVGLPAHLDHGVHPEVRHRVVGTRPSAVGPHQPRPVRGCSRLATGQADHPVPARQRPPVPPPPRATTCRRARAGPAAGVWLATRSWTPADHRAHPRDVSTGEKIAGSIERILSKEYLPFMPLSRRRVTDAADLKALAHPAADGAARRAGHRGPDDRQPGWAGCWRSLRRTAPGTCASSPSTASCGEARGGHRAQPALAGGERGPGLGRERRGPDGVGRSPRRR